MELVFLPPNLPSYCPLWWGQGDLEGGFLIQRISHLVIQGVALRDMAGWNSQAHKPDEVNGDYSHGRGFFHF